MAMHAKLVFDPPEHAEDLFYLSAQILMLQPRHVDVLSRQLPPFSSAPLHVRAKSKKDAK